MVMGNYLVLLFKSLKKCKRRNKGNFTLKSNEDKIMLCGWGARLSCFKYVLTQ